MRAAGVGKAEQLGDLVERFARGVVARAAEQAVLSPRLDVEQQRVAARDEQRRERRHRVRDARARSRRGVLPCGARRSAACPRERERLREAHADEQRADEARARSSRRSRRCRSARRRRRRSARSTTGTIAVRCARDAISGTTPPKIAMHVLREDHERLERARRRRCPSSTAADVSSHDVSIPRMRIMARIGDRCHLHA